MFSHTIIQKVFLLKHRVNCLTFLYDNNFETTAVSGPFSRFAYGGSFYLVLRDLGEPPVGQGHWSIDSSFLSTDKLSFVKMSKI